ncbi:hypothetical protein EO95_13330 [Methanosarcina sp. 1.H.T.1A.1]|uniref:KAP family P-loop NTPase fold protein n=1 Tax=Methanosarcina sp. 1.H.T.1A.1 TaxID=1483602 RepID=UPI00062250CA|nr:P-loop NTPase fold protein [Methanosarcina sp. 1.H.T.1A.1]KKH99664.1 hypothetical protein EO95_13330 [Methanosarcina sp. 1.H.T.1A.1]
MFQPDKPIKLCSEDSLGRKEFARSLCLKILEIQKKDSLVIGLYGQWGSGKTSLINMIIECIEETSGLDDNCKPIIVRFNPWNFSEQNQLIVHFFDQLSSTLGKGNNSKVLKDVGKLLQTYAKVVKPLTYIPGVGEIASLSSDLCESIGDASTKSGEYIEKDLNGLKEELSGILEQLDKKIIIVIDDIDRLSQSEIKQIFKLVKVIADFPNTLYILAFDDQVVTKNLNEQVDVSGRDYLNKIIQVSFNIPYVKQYKINRILLNELDRILSTLPESYNKYFDELYWSNIYHSGFKNFFKNIRDINRFSNSLEFNMSLMHKEESMEVNPIDFIAIESIRVFCPEFYSFMKSKNNLFTSIGNRENSAKEEIEAALSKVDISYRSDLRSLLFVLFPQMSTIFGNMSYAPEFQSKWNKQLRVCATDYFDAYFTLIPGGDEEELSQYELDLILKQINNPKQFKNSLLGYVDDKKIHRVLERLQDYADDEDYFSVEYAENIVQVLFDISDLLSNEPKGMWYLGGAGTDAKRIIFQILKRQQETTRNYELLKKTISHSKGLEGPVGIVFSESKSQEENRLIPADTLKELQDLCVSKIKEFVEEGRLINNENFVSILFRWKEWDDSKSWNTYVENLINTDEGLTKFVEKFTCEVYSQTLGDYGYRTIKKFNYKNLNEFIELQIVKNRLQKIKQANNMLYESKKEIVDFFLNNFKDISS